MAVNPSFGTDAVSKDIIQTEDFLTRTGLTHQFQIMRSAELISFDDGGYGVKINLAKPLLGQAYSRSFKATLKGENLSESDVARIVTSINNRLRHDAAAPTAPKRGAANDPQPGGKAAAEGTDTTFRARPDERPAHIRKNEEQPKSGKSFWKPWTWFRNNKPGQEEEPDTTRPRFILPENEGEPKKGEPKKGQNIDDDTRQDLNMAVVRGLLGGKLNKIEFGTVTGSEIRDGKLFVQLDDGSEKEVDCRLTGGVAKNEGYNSAQEFIHAVLQNHFKVHGTKAEAKKSKTEAETSTDADRGNGTSTEAKDAPVETSVDKDTGPTKGSVPGQEAANDSDAKTDPPAADFKTPGNVIPMTAAMRKAGASFYKQTGYDVEDVSEIRFGKSADEIQIKIPGNDKLINLKVDPKAAGFATVAQLVDSTNQLRARAEYRKQHHPAHVQSFFPVEVGTKPEAAPEVKTTETQTPSMEKPEPANDTTAKPEKTAFDNLAEKMTRDSAGSTRKTLEPLTARSKYAPIFAKAILLNEITDISSIHDVADVVDDGVDGLIVELYDGDLRELKVDIDESHFKNTRELADAILFAQENEIDRAWDEHEASKLEASNG